MPGLAFVRRLVRRTHETLVGHAVGLLSSAILHVPVAEEICHGISVNVSEILDLHVILDGMVNAEVYPGSFREVFFARVHYYANRFLGELAFTRKQLWLKVVRICNCMLRGHDSMLLGTLISICKDGARLVST
jgi:hypothetical protein